MSGENKVVWLALLRRRLSRDYDLRGWRHRERSLGSGGAADAIPAKISGMNSIGNSLCK